MTWIIGTPRLFGFAAGFSDIRVTFPDNSERDCLRKIHWVGRHIAAGFAGSVRIGFAMIQELTELLAPANEGQGWLPGAIANWWPEDARRVFRTFDERERRLSCEIMLIGAHPSETIRDSGWPRTEVYTFSAPDFEPVQARDREILSIGSGTAVEPYRNLLDNIWEHEMMFAQMEIGNPGGFGRGLMASIAEEIPNHATAGISPHVHICLVTRPNIRLGNNNLIAPEQPEVPDFIMPPVAETWQEFVAMVHGADGEPERASC